MENKAVLKRCPSCGDKANIIKAHGCKFVRCSRCEIQSARYGEHISDERMIADWNRRSPLPEAAQELYDFAETTAELLRLTLDCYAFPENMQDALKERILEAEKLCKKARGEQ